MADTEPAVEPFRVEVAEDVLADLRERILDTRWPDQLADAGWDYGTDLGWLRRTAAYWADGYDWRQAEAALNTWPHLLTTIDGQRIHAIHARSPHPDALPLLITHGWPGSVAEFLEVIGPLIDPTVDGGDPADAFHVVVPSLPGYGWSGPTTERGWDVKRSAGAFAQLMARLGYDRYGAQGGDWGSFVTRHIALLDPEHVVGIHLNMIMAGPGEGDDPTDVTPHEAGLLARGQEYFAEGSGYMAIQSTRPQSLAYGLNDSPVGLLAWIGEKFHAWTDNDGDVEDAVSLDALLTDVTIYWVTQTAGSSARMYYESLNSMAVATPPVTGLPVGVASFPKEILGAARKWAERDHNIVHWTEMPRGGHFAAMEEPDLFVADVRTFFRGLR
jgi:pimeloyl-ACP methyl ester carboxylesterase